jgi:hypothetical protein
MNGENAFLLDCVRSFLQPKTPLSVPSDLDWPKFLRCAQKHSVTPLVCWILAGTYTREIPAPVLGQLRDNLRETAQFNLTLSAELVKLLALLQREEIEVVPLKGPTLSASLYGNLALRSFADLDLLFHQRDVLRVKSLLEANGYALTSTLHWPSGPAVFRARESQLSFADPRGIVSVDMHWGILPDYMPPAFDVNHIWKMLRAVPFAGVMTRTLSPEHLVLFLCAHGAKHLWERVGWICDFARVLQVENSVDWSYVFAQAAQTDTSRMLVLALLLAEKMAGVEIPSAAVERLAPDPQARLLARYVQDRFLSNAPHPAPAWEAARFGMRAFERQCQRARYIVGSFLVPSEAEYRVLKLPDAFYLLYYLFRPLRLIAKYSRRCSLLPTKRH